MIKSKHFYRIFIALMGALICWWLFTAGYYLAFTRAETEKIRLVTNDTKLTKYVVEKIKKGDSARAIETLQGMNEVKKAYIEATHQVLDNSNVFSFSFRPDLIIQRSDRPSESR